MGSSLEYRRVAFDCRSSLVRSVRSQSRIAICESLESQIELLCCCLEFPLFVRKAHKRLTREAHSKQHHRSRRGRLQLRTLSEASDAHRLHWAHKEIGQRLREPERESAQRERERERERAVHNNATQVSHRRQCRLVNTFAGRMGSRWRCPLCLALAVVRSCRWRCLLARSLAFPLRSQNSRSLSPMQLVVGNVVGVCVGAHCKLQVESVSVCCCFVALICRFYCCLPPLNVQSTIFAAIYTNRHQMDYTSILYGEIHFKPANKAANNNNNNIITNTSNGNLHIDNPNSIQLCDPDLVKLDWLQAEKIGGGLINVGNTCFLNSVLQCLTYCPPLYNFLVKLNGGHSQSCKINQFCMLCEMEKHVKRIKNSTGSAIKPISIVQRLKYINKSFQFGRQEDAHEFLRYILDHMWKACLLNLDINLKTNSKLNPRIKETTVINHIFGGYHRSQVLCLTCNSRTNTFDFFMDFILDISNAKSLEDALRKFTQSEILEHENAYKCSQCRRKVTARKKFTVYKAPNVATFQLKRFDSDRIFGGKISKYISYPDELDLRPYMSDTSKLPIKYQLAAVLVHSGSSSNSGHYFCFIKNSNNFWYKMDDSHVTLVNQAAVLQQQAYVLFYTRKQTSKDSHSIAPSIQAGDIKYPSSAKQSTHPKLLKQTNGNFKITNFFAPMAPLTTWQGSKSKLDEQELNTNGTERDKFNDELDQGKTKKIKYRDHRFNNLSKTNPFQRFTSNGYQQYNDINKKRNKNNFHKHKGRNRRH